MLPEIEKQYAVGSHWHRGSTVEQDTTVHILINSGFVHDFTGNLSKPDFLYTTI